MIEPDWEKTYVSKYYHGKGAGAVYGDRSVYHRIDGWEQQGNWSVIKLLCNGTKLDWKLGLNDYSSRIRVPIKDRCVRCEKLAAAAGEK